MPLLRHLQRVHGVVHQRRYPHGHVEACQLRRGGGGLLGRRLERGREPGPVPRPRPAELRDEPRGRPRGRRHRGRDPAPPRLCRRPPRRYSGRSGAREARPRGQREEQPRHPSTRRRSGPAGRDVRSQRDPAHQHRPGSGRVQRGPVPGDDVGPPPRRGRDQLDADPGQGACKGRSDEDLVGTRTREHDGAGHSVLPENGTPDLGEVRTLRPGYSGGR